MAKRDTTNEQPLNRAMPMGSQDQQIRVRCGHRFSNSRIDGQVGDAGLHHWSNITKSGIQARNGVGVAGDEPML